MITTERWTLTQIKRHAQVGRRYRVTLHRHAPKYGGVAPVEEVTIEQVRAKGFAYRCEAFKGDLGWHKWGPAEFYRGDESGFDYYFGGELCARYDYLKESSNDPD